MSTSSVGILGSGNIGHTLAVHSVRIGHGVFLANARGPESLGEVVRRLGPQARAATVADAVRHAEIVILAVPWTARQATFEAAGGAAAFAGKIVVDAMNPYTDYPRVEDLGGRPSSAVVASELGSGARVVKAFNTIQAGTLANGARPGSPEEERIAIPVCGDDGAAKQVVSTFIEAVGFAPVDAGTLSASRMQEPHQPLYDKDHTAAQVRAHLAASAPHA